RGWSGSEGRAVGGSPRRGPNASRIPDVTGRRSSYGGGSAENAYMPLMSTNTLGKRARPCTASSPSAVYVASKRGRPCSSTSSADGQKPRWLSTTVSSGSSSTTSSSSAVWSLPP